MTNTVLSLSLNVIGLSTSILTITYFVEDVAEVS